MLSLPKQKIQELTQLLAILATQRRIVQKGLVRLMGKLRSMHLTVPGAVANLYHVQCALTQWIGGTGPCSL